MPRPVSDSPSPSEWKVMKIVWQLKSCAARDVYTIAGEQFGWAPNTVRTHLSRLVDKGFLKARLVGTSYLYSPARSMRKTLIDAADDLLDKVTGGNAGPLLAHMVRRSELSREDVGELRSILDQYEEEKYNRGR